MNDVLTEAVVNQKVATIKALLTAGRKLKIEVTWSFKNDHTKSYKWTGVPSLSEEGKVEVIYDQGRTKTVAYNLPVSDVHYRAIEVISEEVDMPGAVEKDDEPTPEQEFQIHDVSTWTAKIEANAVDVFEVFLYQKFEMSAAAPITQRAAFDLLAMWVRTIYTYPEQTWQTTTNVALGNALVRHYRSAAFVSAGGNQQALDNQMRQRENPDDMLGISMAKLSVKSPTKMAGVQCHKCHKYGHLARNCRTKPGFQARGVANK